MGWVSGRVGEGWEAERVMAKKGILSKHPQWWKHWRWVKRDFWKRERKAAERDIQDRLGKSYWHDLRK